MKVISNNLEKREIKSFPLRIEQFKGKGWFFIACDAIPGLTVFGPDLFPLMEKVKIAGEELLRERGQNVHLTVRPVASASPRSISWNTFKEYELLAA